MINTFSLFHSGTCADCGAIPPDPNNYTRYVCHDVSRCAACNLKHRAVTPEQLARQTAFCVTMHFACAADGLGACPTCGAHVSVREA